MGYQSPNGAFGGYARTPATSTPSYAPYDTNMVTPISKAGGFVNTQPYTAPQFLPGIILFFVLLFERKKSKQILIFVRARSHFKLV